MTERNQDPNQPETRINQAEMEDLPLQTLMGIVSDKLQRATNTMDRNNNLHVDEKLHNALDGRDYNITTLSISVAPAYFHTYRAPEMQGKPQHLSRQLPEPPDLPSHMYMPQFTVIASDHSDTDTLGAFRCQVYNIIRVGGLLRATRLDTYVQNLEQIKDPQFAQTLSAGQTEAAEIGLDRPDAQELMALCRSLELAEPVYPQPDKAQRRPELN